MNEIVKILKSIEENGGYYTKRSPALRNAISKGYLKEVKHNIYQITKSGHVFLLDPELSNKKSVLNTIKKAIAVLIIIGKAAWKYVVAVSIAFLGSYLTIGDNFKLFIKWITSFFH